MVAAHFGGYTEWEKSYQILCGSGVYFDTSSTLWKLPVEQAQKMIAKHGIEKFLFGAEYPMWNHVEELGRIKKLGLNDSELEMVLYKNAVSLLEL